MRRLIALGLMLFAGPVLAALDVVSTTASLGMLAREIGGPGVQVTVLAPPDRDAHMLQAKPSMMRALRDADLVIALGAELETGWLPAATAGAGNRTLLPGQIGYFEAAAQVPLLDAGGVADRAHGDVHPMGNPHLNLDPVRMARVGLALAERLGKLDPAGLAGYRERARSFSAAVEARLPGWRARAAGAPGAVTYHKDGNYLFALLDVPVLGYVEPVPGVPPTASHLQALAGKLKGQRGVLLRHSYQSPRGAETLAQALGWKVHVVELEPAKNADASSYFALIDQWVAALASAKH
ncbi:MAG: metal ABC transporter substrate-binding protein [Pseudomonadota bacterium]